MSLRATVAYGEDMKDRARFLRSNDRSISDIASLLGVARGTVGNWVKGFGETRHYLTCKLCGETFATSRAHAMFCCNYHRDKHGLLRRRAA